MVTNKKDFSVVQTMQLFPQLIFTWIPSAGLPSVFGALTDEVKVMLLSWVPLGSLLCWWRLLSLDCSCFGRRWLEMVLTTVAIAIDTTAIAVSSALEATTASSAAIASVHGSWLICIYSPGVVVTITPGVSSVDVTRLICGWRTEICPFPSAAVASGMAVLLALTVTSTVSVLFRFAWSCFCICKALLITHEFDDIGELSRCHMLACAYELLLPGLWERVKNTLLDLELT